MTRPCIVPRCPVMVTVPVMFCRVCWATVPRSLRDGIAIAARALNLRGWNVRVGQAAAFVLGELRGRTA